VGFVSFPREKLSIKEKKMNHLKNENINHCLSLLREYVINTRRGNKTGAAILALEHLQKITAGQDQSMRTEGYDLACNGSPRINGL
jgi:hypothetical protein